MTPVMNVDKIPAYPAAVEALKANPPSTSAAQIKTQRLNFPASDQN
jgi:hypothetical protein